jgi:hypothetical protein
MADLLEDLLEDQEPVLQGPPFNKVIDLTKLPHEKLITRAQAVFTKWNPQGHPPTSVSSPTMQSLIDGLEVTRESCLAIANPMRNKSPPSDSSYNGSVLSDDKDSKTTIQAKTTGSYCDPGENNGSQGGQKDEGTKGPVRLFGINTRPQDKT